MRVRISNMCVKLVQQNLKDFAYLLESYGAQLELLLMVLIVYAVGWVRTVSAIIHLMVVKLELLSL
jgi:hypothetical protein